MQREPLDQIFDFFHDWPFLGSILGKILKFSKKFKIFLIPDPENLEILPKSTQKRPKNEKCQKSEKDVFFASLRPNFMPIFKEIDLNGEELLNFKDF